MIGPEARRIQIVGEGKCRAGFLGREELSIVQSLGFGNWLENRQALIKNVIHEFIAVVLFEAQATI